MTIKGADGNVGIGTTAPGTLLSLFDTGSTSAVQEFIRLENKALGGTGAGSSINFHHYHAGSGPVGGAKAATIASVNSQNWASGTPSSYSTDLAFSTLNENTFAERVRIASDGNVGIGTDAPANRLSVAHAGGVGAGKVNILRVGFNSWNDSNEARIVFGLPGTAAWQVGGISTFVNGTTRNLNFYVADSAQTTLPTAPKLTIDQGGNVGIGTTAPSTNLEVENAGEFYVLFDDSSNSKHTTFRTGNDASTISYASEFRIREQPYANRGTGSSDTMRLQIKSDGDVLVCNNGGSVGIGTNAPSKKLEIDAGDGGHLMLQYSGSTSNSGGTRQYFQRSRGTSASPSGTSDGDAVGTISFVGYAPGGSTYRNAAAFSVTREGAGNTVSAPAKIAFSTTSATGDTLVDRLTIMPGGAVGIGTGSPNPNYKLHIYSTSTATAAGLRVQGSVTYGDGAEFAKLQLMNSVTSTTASIVAFYDGANNNTGLAFKTDASAGTYERMRIHRD
jgi:hypothetical protein